MTSYSAWIKLEPDSPYRLKPEREAKNSLLHSGTGAVMLEGVTADQSGNDGMLSTGVLFGCTRPGKRSLVFSPPKIFLAGCCGPSLQMSWWHKFIHGHISWLRRQLLLSRFDFKCAVPRWCDAIWRTPASGPFSGTLVILFVFQFPVYNLVWSHCSRPNPQYLFTAGVFQPLCLDLPPLPVPPRWTWLCETCLWMTTQHNNDKLIPIESPIKGTSSDVISNQEFFFNWEFWLIWDICFTSPWTHTQWTLEVYFIAQLISSSSSQKKRGFLMKRSTDWMRHVFVTRESPFDHVQF